jgi:hypothetical protein
VIRILIVEEIVERGIEPFRVSRMDWVVACPGRRFLLPDMQPVLST